MRILLVHNYYGSSAPSGENRVFESEKEMLKEHGETVDVYTRHSDEIRLVNGGAPLLVGLRKVFNLVKGALCTIGNPFAAHALAQKIREFHPDIVHIHNQFPLISPLAIRAAHRSGAKVVMTLHNYRTVCAAGVPTRNGQVCTECFKTSDLGRDGCLRASTSPDQTYKVNVSNLSEFCKGQRTIWPAIRNRCYRGSLLATVPLALNIWLYRKCWAKWVDRFVVLSDFQRNRMIECGFPAEKIRVKGNFLRSFARNEGAIPAERHGCVYVGRLSDEKGVRVLIEAWRVLGARAPELTIMGDGDRRSEYENLATGLAIGFAGQLSHENVMRRLESMCCLIQPTVCWETFGLTVVEAASVGTPAIVSDLGALPSLIEGCGSTFKAGDSKSLAKAVGDMLTRSDWDEMSRRAKQIAMERYSVENNYRQLQSIYKNLTGE